jgi:3-hydroxyacyl-CoA dehydrogenase
VWTLWKPPQAKFDGMVTERDIFINLMWTPESRALRHVFM